MKTQFSQLKRIELDKAFIELIEGNISVLEFKQDVVIELRDAIEINKAIYSMVKGQSFLSLIDARVYGSITADAREFFAKDELTKDIRIAEAFVIVNLPTRLFAKFYIKINKPANPIKIFSDFDDAKIWLKLQGKNKFGEIPERNMSFHENFKEN